MTVLKEMIADGVQESGGFWPRARIGTDTWHFAGERLASGDWVLGALWGEPDRVHLALYEPASGDCGTFSLATTGGAFPSLAARHSPAIRLERALCDLYGFTAVGAPDPRPWLDHGRWGVRAPLGDSRPCTGGERYAFLASDGEALHQIPVGPVHAGIIEPGHFRFTASGETVVRLEERLGYVHKGIERLLVGAPLDHAAKLGCRISGDSTVAYGIAFARAVEAACGTSVPSRAHFLRALMLELERIANHLGDVGAICNDAAFTIMHAHCAVLREGVLRAAAAAFGHRLMMDRVIPGGVAVDLDLRGRTAIAKLVVELRRRFPALVTLYEETASLQDRTVGTGVLRADLAAQFGAGGYVGRASARRFDARKAFAFAPYDTLAFETPVLEEGDVDARLMIRVREIEQSLALIDQLLDRLPSGEILSPPPVRAAEGVALVEGFRGDVFAWVRLNGDGSIARAHLRDPSWFQWPLLEAAIEGNIVADFPLCNKSFNCSYAGHDL